MQQKYRCNRTPRKINVFDGYDLHVTIANRWGFTGCGKNPALYRGTTLSRAINAQKESGFRVSVRTRKQIANQNQARRAGAKRQPSPDPDFLWNLLALAQFMRLSLTKAAHADFGGASCRKSGEGLGHRSAQYRLSARGAAPADEGSSAAPPALPDLGSASQPFRAGLTFGSRPYGPGSDLLFISSSHADSLASAVLLSLCVEGGSALSSRGQSCSHPVGKTAFRRVLRDGSALV